MSEQVLLLNPRRRAKRRRMPAALRRYWATRRRRAVNPRMSRATRNRRRRLRARGVKLPRYRTRHALHVRRNPRRRYRMRRYRAHNPRRRRFGGGTSVRGMVNHYVMPGVIGGVGTLALDVVYGYVQPYLPAQFQAGWFGVATKLGVILATGWALNRFAPRLRAKTQVAVLGATTVLAYGAIKQAVGSMLPATSKIPGLSGGLGAYVQDFQRLPVRGASLGAYMARQPGLGDYFSPAAVIGAGPRGAFNGLGAYQPHISNGNHVAGFDYMNDGM